MRMDRPNFGTDDNAFMPGVPVIENLNPGIVNMVRKNLLHRQCRKVKCGRNSKYEETCFMHIYAGRFDMQYYIYCKQC